MTNETKVTAESHVAEALNATVVAAEATQKANTAQMADVVDQRLEAFFNRGIQGERFVPLKSGMMADRERFQFMCDKIANMDARLDDWEKSRVTRESLKEVAQELAKVAVTKEDFALLRQRSDLVSYILGAIGMAMILAMVGALMTLLLK